MTNEQAKKMLKAKLECLKRETSGTDFDCNNSNCDDSDFVYEVGKTVSVDNFCEDRWEECSSGIHFFINRQESVNY